MITDGDFQIYGEEAVEEYTTPGGVKVYVLTEEEYAEKIEAAIQKFKDAGPRWQDRLADCHFKCSEPFEAAHHAAFLMTPEREAALYREAGLEPPG